MANTSESLSRTPLFDLQQDLNARWVPFSGWEMPVQYQGLVVEHQAVRSTVGLFDISHMGKFILRGPQIKSQLARLVPTDLDPIQPGEGQYTVLLNAEAGIIDDIILYAQGPDPDQPSWDRWTVIVNAATTATDRQWLESHLPEGTLQDESSDQTLLAIQGPQALAQLQPLIHGSLSALKRFQHQSSTLKSPTSEAVFIARSGYTGEDGFEVMTSIEGGRWLWQTLMANQVQPCGLGCRDTLRLEAAMHLYGQDMDETTTPLEANLKWLVNSTASYIGQDHLTTQSQTGPQRKLVGLRMQGREIARNSYPIFYQDQPVGTITSGTKSPTLGYAIALGYVRADLARPGTELMIEIRGKQYPATVVKRPFYRSATPAPRNA